MRIAIIDDDRLMTRILSDSVRNIIGDDAEITIYNDPLVAKEVSGTRPAPDIVFMDIEMPGLSGIELAKHVKSVFPKIHIVFVTAYTEYALMAWKLHVDDYIVKPIKQEDIRRVMDHICLLDNSGNSSGSKLKIRCFGKFEVYHDAIPVKFSRSKAKELLAYLIAARGSGVTSGELCGVLWDDAMELSRKKTYLRQYAASLRSALRDCGCEEAFLHSRDSYSVNIGMIDCDYYRYLIGDTSHGCVYQGEFMTQYAWAEEIGAQLSDFSL